MFVIPFEMDTQIKRLITNRYTTPPSSAGLRQNETFIFAAVEKLALILQQESIRFELNSPKQNAALRIGLKLTYRKKQLNIVSTLLKNKKDTPFIIEERITFYSCDDKIDGVYKLI